MNPHRQLARRERLRFHDGILPSQKRSQMIPGSKLCTDPGKTDLGERLARNAETLKAANRRAEGGRDQRPTRYEQQQRSK